MTAKICQICQTFLLPKFPVIGIVSDVLELETIKGAVYIAIMLYGLVNTGVSDYG